MAYKVSRRNSELRLAGGSVMTDGPDFLLTDVSGEVVRQLLALGCLTRSGDQGWQKPRGDGRVWVV